MIVLMVTIGPPTDCIDPGARNSNLLPVKANGLVRLRSPGSVGRTGRVSAPMISVPFSSLPICAKPRLMTPPRLAMNIFGEHGRPGYNSFVATFVLAFLLNAAAETRATRSSSRAGARTRR